MTIAAKLAVSLLAVAGIVLAARHGAAALNPALPKDMPRTAQFVQSGYNINSDEPKGDWVACRLNPDSVSDLCRVTDAHGTVIYQGAFLPVGKEEPTPDSQLKLKVASEEQLWVHGPDGEGPVPAIPLANGEILVPAADSFAFADRWKSDPDELRHSSAL